MANERTILLVPTTAANRGSAANSSGDTKSNQFNQSLAISRADGFCRSFGGVNSRTEVKEEKGEDCNRLKYVVSKEVR